jgi:hypothetical protein
MTRKYVGIFLLVMGCLTGNAYAGGICAASSKATLDSCIAGLASGANDAVEITQDIDCPTTGTDCAYVLRGIGSATRPIEIYGSSPAVTLFRNPSVHLFSVENSANVTIRDLTILERNKRSHDYRSCQFERPDSAPIVIAHDLSTGLGESSSIFLDNLTIDTGEPDVIDIGRSEDVNVLDSYFSGAGHFGIWTSGQDAKNTLRIFGNTFTGMGANAILLAAATNTFINGNTIDGNHWNNPFCVGEDQHHSGGGQIALNGDIDGLTIQSNYIINGGNSGVSGIEFSDGSVGAIRNVDIYANQIHDDPNGAVTFNIASPQQVLSGVVIRENAMYNNGVGHNNVQINGQRDVDIYDNYYTQNLSASPRANFTGTAKTCALGGNTTCTVTINWQSQSAPGTKVIVDGTGLFSINPSGAQAAPWVGASGDVFEITSTAVEGGNEPIARIFVKGQ